MKSAVQIRYGLLGGVVALLAACSSTTPTTSSTSIGTGSWLPTGQSLPLNYVYAPGKGGVSYRVVDYRELPQWQQQSFADSLKSFKSGCLKLQNMPSWQVVCRQAQQTAARNHDAKYFFEHYFTPWQVSQNGQVAGTVTGYYEPILLGDAKATTQARYPIYGMPNDFVVVPLSANQRQGVVRIRLTGSNSGVISSDGAYAADLSTFPLNAKTTSLKGRVSGNQFVPYYTRAQINAGALNGKAPILGYANDPVELFFLHIQGSGRLKTPDGRLIRLGFAAKNDYPYVSIGKYMANKGYLPLAQTSMQGIKGWLQKNPQKLGEVLGQNPSYVFFQAQSEGNDGPIGALGVPLMGGYAGAVDRHFISLGAPLFLATTHPVSGFGLNRLIMAQDTGSAINGAVRVDYFWGYGDDAGATAGKMKHTGYVWQLLPKGMLPEVK
ncbi:murein transglycosylase A [Snodgrassella sp. CFCC 13594]|uniref:murein transglycosylase A n=1 Tax=Snodgrassella sp. CFCC 13594 TaxID=1775559 RepID=UPI0008362203|nr:MltA domain-containing protein [Snodgrassella sp. CFCC 13594]